MCLYDPLAPDCGECPHLGLDCDEEWHDADIDRCSRGEWEGWDQ